MVKVASCDVGCPPGDKVFVFPSIQTDKKRRKTWLDYFDIEDQKRVMYACKRHFSNEQRIGNNLKLNGVPDIPVHCETPGPFQTRLMNWRENVIVVTPRDPEFVIYKNQTGIFSQDQFQNVNNVTNTIQLPILQTSPIQLPMLRTNPTMPTIKTVSCSMTTQTNKRICGSVQISEFLDEYRLNCFYCSNTFPIEKYSKFIKHLKDRHFEKEEAFKIKKYPFGDHDYTTVRSRSPERINAGPSPPSTKSKFMESKDRPFNVGMAEILMKLLDETLLNPNFRLTEEDNILVIKSNANNRKNLSGTNVLEQIINTKSDASPEVQKSTLINKKSVTTSTLNVKPNLKENTALKPESSSIKPCIEPISDINSEYETNISTSGLVLTNVTPTPSNITENSLSPTTSNIDTENFTKPHAPLSSINKPIKETVEKRVVQQTLRNINDFETIYKTVKKRPARAMSSGIFYIKDIKNNKMPEKQTSKQSALHRCLKRVNTDTTESMPTAIQSFKPNPTELVFQFTPRDIIMDLLDTIKDYPILWEFHKEPDNENYAETINDVCEKLNKKWSLNISPLQMRRSINRIFTDYRYMSRFKKELKSKEYFQKLAEFLPSSENDIPRRRCQYCDICYAKNCEMKKHLVEEHKYNSWQYQCSHCFERFLEINEYELHKHLPHYDEIFKCEDCSKSYTTIYTLERHKRNFHAPKLKVTPTTKLKVTPKPPVQKCNVCDKEFKNSSELTSHKTYHKEKRFKCHLCPKAYFQKTTLDFHLKKHKDQLDFVCEVCGKAFLKSSHLNSHLEKHTGEKVTCNICHIKLRKRSLSRHLRLCHVACEGTIESTYRAQCYHYKRFTNQYITSARQPFRRPFKRTNEGAPRIYDCKKCKIPFDRLKYLKEHNKNVHADVKIMPCKICNIQFRHTQNIKFHYRQKHNLTMFQVFKLHDQNMDLDTVLKLQTEDMPEAGDTAEIPILKREQSLLDLANDETNQNNLQDEIMKAVENIDKQEIKVDNDHSMNAFFTDLLKRE